VTSHDRLFKSLFQAFFRELLLLVDANLAARLAPEAVVEFLDKELLPEFPDGEHRVVDLLAAMPDQSGQRALLIHVEIERTARKRIGQRLWRYSLHLRVRHPEPLASLVVFLRGGPPGARWGIHLEETAGEEVVRFRYLSYGLSKLPAETLLSRPEPLAWALAALAKPGPLGRARLKLEALQKIATAQVREAERLLLINCVETYLTLNGREAEEYASLCRTQESPEIETMELTWADQIEAKATKKGLARGLEQGLKRGLERGLETGRERALQEGADHLRRLVTRHLGQRFGKVPASLRKRLAAIRSLDELSAIADRIFEVQSIEELGLGG